MKLWTMQPVEVYDILERDGVYRTDKEKIDMPEFLPTYDWLCKHLEQKDTKPESVKYPVWAWYRFDGIEKKPDLRHSCYGVRGEEMVCVELEIPDDKVLLTDFDLWHFVLNDWWLDTAMFKNGYTEEQYDQNRKWFKALSPEEQLREKEKSWEIIFDIEAFENDWISKGQYVQGIFWEIKRENVRKIQRFTAR